jgi:hypothetical protein
MSVLLFDVTNQAGGKLDYFRQSGRAAKRVPMRSVSTDWGKFAKIDP